MSKEPVVCFDLDGTLIHLDEKVHPEDLAVLANPPEGVRLIITTGRLRRPVKMLFDRCGLFLGRPVPFPMVLQNGSALYAAGEELIEYRPFEQEVQKELLDIIVNKTRAATLLSNVDDYHVVRPSSFIRKAAVRFDIEMEPFHQNGTPFALGKAMGISDVPEELAELADLTRHLPVEQYYSMPIIFEITPQGSNKGVGLSRLLKELNLEDHPIYAAGDGGNDLPMFEMVNRSFAPATAPEKVRSKASRVIDVRQRGLLTPILEEIGILKPPHPVPAKETQI